MEKISRELLVQRAGGSLYKLCNMAAMRAMELNVGMKKLVESDPGEKVTSIAIREIAEGKVTLKDVKE